MYYGVLIPTFLLLFNIKLSYCELSKESKIESTVEVGGKKYNVTCMCPKGIDSLEEILQSDDINQCLSAKVKIRMNSYTRNDVLTNVVDNIAHLPKEAYDYVRNNHFSCIDHRTKHPSYFTLGGDLGDFLMMLNNVTRDVPWDYESVSAALNSYLSTLSSGRLFYHCTDLISINNIAQDIGLESVDLVNVPKEIQNKLIQKLHKSKNIGDVFIKKLLDHPQIFGISTQLIQFTLESFYKLLWDKKNPLSDKLILEVLIGEFNPKLFIEISSIKHCEISGILPKITPNIKKFQTLIYSESASYYRRRELAKFANRYFDENYSHFLNKLDYQYFNAIDGFGKQLGHDFPFIQLILI